MLKSGVVENPNKNDQTFFSHGWVQIVCRISIPGLFSNVAISNQLNWDKRDSGSLEENRLNPPPRPWIQRRQGGSGVRAGGDSAGQYGRSRLEGRWSGEVGGGGGDGGQLVLNVNCAELLRVALGDVRGGGWGGHRGDIC